MSEETITITEIPNASQLRAWVDLYWSDPKLAEKIESSLGVEFAQQLRAVANIIEERSWNLKLNADHTLYVIKNKIGDYVESMEDYTGDIKNAKSFLTKTEVTECMHINPRWKDVGEEVVQILTNQ